MAPPPLHPFSPETPKIGDFTPVERSFQNAPSHLLNTVPLQIPSLSIISVLLQLIIPCYPVLAWGPRLRLLHRAEDGQTVVVATAVPDFRTSCRPLEKAPRTYTSLLPQLEL